MAAAGGGWRPPALPPGGRERGHFGRGALRHPTPLKAPSQAPPPKPSRVSQPGEAGKPRPVGSLLLPGGTPPAGSLGPARREREEPCGAEPGSSTDPPVPGGLCLPSVTGGTSPSRPRPDSPAGSGRGPGSCAGWPPAHPSSAASSWWAGGREGARRAPTRTALPPAAPCNGTSLQQECLPGPLLCLRDGTGGDRPDHLGSADLASRGAVVAQALRPRWLGGREGAALGRCGPRGGPRSQPPALLSPPPSPASAAEYLRARSLRGGPGRWPAAIQKGPAASGALGGLRPKAAESRAGSSSLSWTSHFTRAGRGGAHRGGKVSAGRGPRGVPCPAALLGGGSLALPPALKGGGGQEKWPRLFQNQRGIMASEKDPPPPAPGLGPVTPTQA